MKAVVYNRGEFKMMLIDNSIIDNEIVGKGRIHIDPFNLDLKLANKPVFAVKNIKPARPEDIYIIIFSDTIDFEQLRKMVNEYINN